MTHLLYIEASPRKQRSASIEVARAFLDAYRRSHPDARVTTLDVWDLDLPEFDGVALEAKYAALEGRERTPSEVALWERLSALSRPFREADHLVISTPMWNWGIPYKLKHLIDAVSQKDLLFSFDEHGLRGLLGGCKAALILARGLDFSGDSPFARWETQESYLRIWLESIGIAEPAVLRVEGTLLAPEGRRAAAARAAELAAGF